MLRASVTNEDRVLNGQMGRKLEREKKGLSSTLRKWGLAGKNDGETFSVLLGAPSKLISAKIFPSFIIFYLVRHKTRNMPLMLLREDIHLSFPRKTKPREGLSISQTAFAGWHSMEDGWKRGKEGDERDNPSFLLLFIFSSHHDGKAVLACFHQVFL